MKSNEAYITLLELWFGILLSFLFFAATGNVIVTNRIPYTLGLLLGCVVSGGMAFGMYTSLKKSLEKEDGFMGFQRGRLGRRAVMAGALLAGMKLHTVSFPAVIIGIYSLKIAAYLQPYTSLYVTERIRKKKGPLEHDTGK